MNFLRLCQLRKSGFDSTDIVKCDGDSFLLMVFSDSFPRHRVSIGIDLKSLAFSISFPWPENPGPTLPDFRFQYRFQISTSWKE
jgi:hypothetical protein